MKPKIIHQVVKISSQFIMSSSNKSLSLNIAQTWRRLAFFWNFTPQVKSFQDMNNCRLLIGVSLHKGQVKNFRGSQILGQILQFLLAKLKV